MRRQVSQENFSRVYREFSRQRYNKYKHQFPRMRESEIVLKIIKEWEHMAHPQKVQLSQIYQQQQFIPHDEEQSHSNFGSPPRTPFKYNELTLPNTQKTKPTPTQTKPKSLLLPYHEDGSEFNRHSDKGSEEVKSDRSSYSLLVMHSSPSRQEKADLPKNHQYILFYKHHYKRLSKEHPRWSAAKLSHIIKLLWMKRQRLVKKSHSKKISKPPRERTIRKLSARALYLRTKTNEGYSRSDAYTMWKKLPFERKTFFKKWGQGEPTGVSLRPLSSKMMLSSEKLQPVKVTLGASCHNLLFLHRC